MSFTNGNTSFNIIYLGGSGSNKGGMFSGGAQITQKITPTTDIYVQGSVNRYQPFNKKYGPGQTSGSVVVGISKKF